MRHVRMLLAVVTAAFLLSACAQGAQPPSSTPVAETTAAATAPTAEQQAGTTVTGAYPAPNANSAYPGPGAEAAVPTISSEPITVPQPASNEVGVTTGTLLRIDGDGERVPYPGGTVYLGLVVPGASGADAMVQLDRNVAPIAITNGLGQFAFADVPPGRYGLMLQAIEGPLLLNNPADGGDLIVEVTGGQVTDLGELAYPLPSPLE